MSISHLRLGASACPGIRSLEARGWRPDIRNVANQVAHRGVGLEEGFQGGLVFDDDLLGVAGADLLEGVGVEFAVLVHGGDDVVRSGLEAVRFFHDELKGMSEAAIAAGEEAEGACMAVDGAAADVVVAGHHGGAAEAKEGVLDSRALGMGADGALAAVAGVGGAFGGGEN